jgi:hypothetical protein
MLTIMSPGTVTAIEMMKTAGMDAKVLRRALDKANLLWQEPNSLWKVQCDSPGHKAMQKVVDQLR